MGQLDLANLTAAATTVAPALYATTVTGASVDCFGYDSALAVLHVGVVTDGTHTPKLQHSDDNSSWADVAAGSLVGAFAAATSSADEVVQEVGYQGTKRYLRVVVTVTGSPSTGGTYGATIVRGHPKYAPA